MAQFFDRAGFKKKCLSTYTRQTYIMYHQHIWMAHLDGIVMIVPTRRWHTTSGWHPHLDCMNICIVLISRWHHNVYMCHFFASHTSSHEQSFSCCKAKFPRCLMQPNPDIRYSTFLKSTRILQTSQLHVCTINPPMHPQPFWPSRGHTPSQTHVHM